MFNAEQWELLYRDLYQEYITLVQRCIDAGLFWEQEVDNTDKEKVYETFAEMGTERLIAYAFAMYEDRAKKMRHAHELGVKVERFEKAESEWSEQLRKDDRIIRYAEALLWAFTQRAVGVYDAKLYKEITQFFSWMDYMQGVQEKDRKSFEFMEELYRQYSTLFTDLDMYSAVSHEGE